MRAIAWALVLPLGIVTALLVAGPAGLWLLLLYPLQVIRLALTGPRSFRVNLLQGAFLMLSKFSELSGHLRFLLNRWRGGPPQLMEYK